jgi:hypothetical protein
MQTVRQLAAGSLIFYTQFSILLFVSNEKLFEKILHEFCFLHADRNEEQFEMIEAVEKRDAPALSTSTGLFENIWY